MTRSPRARIGLASAGAGLMTAYGCTVTFGVEPEVSIEFEAARSMSTARRDDLLEVMVS